MSQKEPPAGDCSVTFLPSSEATALEACLPEKLVDSVELRFEVQETVGFASDVGLSLGYVWFDSQRSVVTESSNENGEFSVNRAIELSVNESTLSMLCSTIHPQYVKKVGTGTGSPIPGLPINAQTNAGNTLERKHRNQASSLVLPNPLVGQDEKISETGVQVQPLCSVGSNTKTLVDCGTSVTVVPQSGLQHQSITSFPLIACPPTATSAPAAMPLPSPHIWHPSFSTAGHTLLGVSWIDLLPFAKGETSVEGYVPVYTPESSVQNKMLLKVRYTLSKPLLSPEEAAQLSSTSFHMENLKSQPSAWTSVLSTVSPSLGGCPTRSADDAANGDEDIAPPVQAHTTSNKHRKETKKAIIASPPIKPVSKKLTSKHNGDVPDVETLESAVLTCAFALPVAPGRTVPVRLDTMLVHSDEVPKTITRAQALYPLHCARAYTLVSDFAVPKNSVHDVQVVQDTLQEKYNQYLDTILSNNSGAEMSIEWTTVYRVFASPVLRAYLQHLESTGVQWCATHWINKLMLPSLPQSGNTFNPMCAMNDTALLLSLRGGLPLHVAGASAPQKFSTSNGYIYMTTETSAKYHSHSVHVASEITCSSSCLCNPVHQHGIYTPSAWPVLTVLDQHAEASSSPMLLPLTTSAQLRAISRHSLSQFYSSHTEESALQGHANSLAASALISPAMNNNPAQVTPARSKRKTEDDKHRGSVSARKMSGLSVRQPAALELDNVIDPFVSTTIAFSTVSSGQTERHEYQATLAHELRSMRWTGDTETAIQTHFRNQYNTMDVITVPDSVAMPAGNSGFAPHTYPLHARHQNSPFLGDSHHTIADIISNALDVVLPLLLAPKTVLLNLTLSALNISVEIDPKIAPHEYTAVQILHALPETNPSEEEQTALACVLHTVRQFYNEVQHFAAVDGVSFEHICSNNQNVQSPQTTLYFSLKQRLFVPLHSFLISCNADDMQETRLTRAYSLLLQGLLGLHLNYTQSVLLPNIVAQDGTVVSLYNTVAALPEAHMNYMHSDEYIRILENEDKDLVSAHALLWLRALSPEGGLDGVSILTSPLALSSSTLCPLWFGLHSSRASALAWHSLGQFYLRMHALTRDQVDYVESCVYDVPLIDQNVASKFEPSSQELLFSDFVLNETVTAGKATFLAATPIPQHWLILAISSRVAALRCAQFCFSHALGIHLQKASTTLPVPVTAVRRQGDVQTAMPITLSAGSVDISLFLQYFSLCAELENCAELHSMAIGLLALLQRPQFLTRCPNILTAYSYVAMVLSRAGHCVTAHAIIAYTLHWQQNALTCQRKGELDAWSGNEVITGYSGAAALPLHIQTRILQWYMLSNCRPLIVTDEVQVHPVNHPAEDTTSFIRSFINQEETVTSASALSGTICQSGIGMAIPAQGNLFLSDPIYAVDTISRDIEDSASNTAALGDDVDDKSPYPPSLMEIHLFTPALTSLLNNAAHLALQYRCFSVSEFILSAAVTSDDNEYQGTPSMTIVNSDDALEDENFRLYLACSYAVAFEQSSIKAKLLIAKKEETETLSQRSKLKSADKTIHWSAIEVEVDLPAIVAMALKTCLDYVPACKTSVETLNAVACQRQAQHDQITAQYDTDSLHAAETLHAYVLVASDNQQLNATTATAASTTLQDGDLHPGYGTIAERIYSIVTTAAPLTPVTAHPVSQTSEFTLPSPDEPRFHCEIASRNALTLSQVGQIRTTCDTNPSVARILLHLHTGLQLFQTQAVQPARTRDALQLYLQLLSVHNDLQESCLFPVALHEPSSIWGYLPLRLIQIVDITRKQFVLLSSRYVLAVLRYAGVAHPEPEISAPSHPLLDLLYGQKKMFQHNNCVDAVTACTKYLYELYSCAGSLQDILSCICSDLSLLKQTDSKQLPSLLQCIAVTQYHTLSNKAQAFLAQIDSNQDLTMTAAYASQLACIAANEDLVDHTYRVFNCTVLHAALKSKLASATKPMPTLPVPAPPTTAAPPVSKVRNMGTNGTATSTAGGTSSSSKVKRVISQSEKNQTSPPSTARKSASTTAIMPPTTSPVVQTQSLQGLLLSPNALSVLSKCVSYTRTPAQYGLHFNQEDVLGAVAPRIDSNFVQQFMETQARMQTSTLSTPRFVKRTLSLLSSLSKESTSSYVYSLRSAQIYAALQDYARAETAIGQALLRRQSSASLWVEAALLAKSQHDSLTGELSAFHSTTVDRQPVITNSNSADMSLDDFIHAAVTAIDDLEQHKTLFIEFKGKGLGKTALTNDKHIVSNVALQKQMLANEARLLCKCRVSECLSRVRKLVPNRQKYEVLNNIHILEELVRK